MSYTQPLSPGLPELLKLYLQQAGLEYNCHQVATVVSFNPAKISCSVKIAMKRVVIVPNKEGHEMEKFLDYPIINDVPVWVMTGGSAVITMPIKVGDECLICFNDRDIDNYIQGRSNMPPETARLHAFTDAIALVGMHSWNKPITNYDPDNICIRAGAGKVDISNDVTTLKAALNDLCTALTSWVDTRGDAPSAGTITAINAAKTKINNILK